MLVLSNRVTCVIVLSSAADLILPTPSTTSVQNKKGENEEDKGDDFIKLFIAADDIDCTGLI